MRPGSLLVRAVGFVAVSGLVVALLPGLLWGYMAVIAVLAAAVVAEAVALRPVRVVVEAEPSHVLNLGEDELVTMQLRTTARKPVRLVCRQVWPKLLEGPSTERRGLVRPGEMLRLDLPVRGVRRGRESLVSPGVSITYLGLVERLLRPSLASEITVVPDLRAVARLHARLNQYALRGLGTRLSARMGKGREFERLREYVRGDDYRDVAWKASARHDKLIVREYRLDRSQDVVLCLDCGHRMAARVGGLTRLDHAVNGAVLLSYVCNRLEDRVGVVSFDASVTSGPRSGRGTAHLRRVTAFVSGTSAGYVHSDYLALSAELRRRLRRRALVVVFTALSEMDPEPLLRAVRAASPPHLVLVAVLRDPDLQAAAETPPANKSELSRSLVARDLWSVREHTIRELRRLGALVVESRPQDVGLDAMNTYIDVKRRQLL